LKRKLFTKERRGLLIGSGILLEPSVPRKLTTLQKVKFPIYYVTFCSSRTFSGPYRAHRAHRAQCAQAVVEHSVEPKSQLPILEWWL